MNTKNTLKIYERITKKSKSSYRFFFIRKELQPLFDNLGVFTLVCSDGTHYSRLNVTKTGKVQRYFIFASEFLMNILDCKSMMKFPLSSKETGELSELFLADFIIQISIHMNKEEILIELNKSSDYKTLKNLFKQTNLFHILGQTHTERWHTAFWSWLFDVNGSHNLKELPLKYLFEFLSQLSDENKKPRTKKTTLPSVQDIHDFEIIETIPNETNNKEKTIDNSRFDTYININNKYKCIIEYKIDARFDIEQLRKYYRISKQYAWKHPIFIYVVPQTRYEEFIDF